MLNNLQEDVNPGSQMIVKSLAVRGRRHNRSVWKQFLKYYQAFPSTGWKLAGPVSTSMSHEMPCNKASRYL